MKKIILICSLLFLAGCGTTRTTITKEVPVVIKPPETLYECPIIDKYPTNVTNKRLAETIVKLDKNNKICHKNINSIRKYVEEAEKNWAPKK